MADADPESSSPRTPNFRRSSLDDERNAQPTSSPVSTPELNPPPPHPVLTAITVKLEPGGSSSSRLSSSGSSSGIGEQGLGSEEDKERPPQDWGDGWWGGDELDGQGFEEDEQEEGQDQEQEQEQDQEQEEDQEEAEEQEDEEGEQEEKEEEEIEEQEEGARSPMVQVSPVYSPIPELQQEQGEAEQGEGEPSSASWASWLESYGRLADFWRNTNSLAGPEEAHASSLLARGPSSEGQQEGGNEQDDIKQAEPEQEEPRQYEGEPSSASHFPYLGSYGPLSGFWRNTNFLADTEEASASTPPAQGSSSGGQQQEQAASVKEEKQELEQEDVRQERDSLSYIELQPRPAPSPDLNSEYLVHPELPHQRISPELYNPHLNIDYSFSPGSSTVENSSQRTEPESEEGLEQDPSFEAVIDQLLSGESIVPDFERDVNRVPEQEPEQEPKSRFNTLMNEAVNTTQDMLRTVRSLGRDANLVPEPEPAPEPESTPGVGFQGRADIVDEDLQGIRCTLAAMRAERQGSGQRSERNMSASPIPVPISFSTHYHRFFEQEPGPEPEQQGRSNSQDVPQSSTAVATGHSRIYSPSLAPLQGLEFESEPGSRSGCREPEQDKEPEAKGKPEHGGRPKSSVQQQERGIRSEEEEEEEKEVTQEDRATSPSPPPTHRKRKESPSPSPCPSPPKRPNTRNSTRRQTRERANSSTSKGKTPSRSSGTQKTRTATTTTKKVAKGIKRPAELSSDTETRTRTAKKKTEALKFRPGPNVASGADDPQQALNNPPNAACSVYVFGANSRGQLGLGHAEPNVAQPTLNPFLTQKVVGVVQLAAGGAHCVALTHANKILTWGDNRDGQLGRDTWGENDSAPQSGSGSDAVLERNEREAVPMRVDFSHLKLPKDTVFVQVAATESATFAVTEFGDVYGWGTFRETYTNDAGEEETTRIGFRPSIPIQRTPLHIPELKYVKKLATGAQHVLALTVIDVKGGEDKDNKNKESKAKGKKPMSKNPKENKTKNAIYAWGANKRDQLGRRMLGRQRDSSSCLIPRLCIFPGDPKCDIGSIGAGDYHSFAVKLDGYVYAWGYNRYGQTGVVKGVDLIQGGSTVPVPTGVAFWATDENKTRTSMLSGGMGHSVAVTNDGRCLSWGLIDGKVLGMRMAMIARDEIISERGLEKILKKPTLVSGIHGVVSKGMAGPSHSILVTRRGTAYAWGSNGEFEVRQPRSDGVELPSAIQTNELRKLRVVDAAVGRQFSILLAE